MSDNRARHPIAITGMHRSGTSMITRGLHQSGLHLIGGDADALLEAADDNPEGFWENKAIVACNDDLLEASGGAWDNPPEFLPQAVDDPRLAEVVEPATAALAGLAENDRWGFKDPRLCLTAAFWLDLQPDLRFVICVRNPLEVALSLKRRNQNSYSLGLSLWERYYRSILELVPEERRIVTHYDSYFLDPAGELRRVCDFVGLEPAELEVRTDLRHHDVGVSLDEANINRTTRDLYQQLCAEAEAPQPPPTVADEGQVRRLVLDGTVAARHAEQRQAAVDRLEERLAESRAAEGAARRELADVRRESEKRRVDLEQVRGELGRLRNDVSNRLETLVDTGDTVMELTHGLRQTVSRLDERQARSGQQLASVATTLDAVHVKLRAVEDRMKPSLTDRVVGRIRRLARGTKRRAAGPSRRVARAGIRRSAPVAKRTARAAVTRMPPPAKESVRRVRRAVADGQASKRVQERVDRVVNALPDPARKVARKGESAVRRSGAVPTSRRVARGMKRRVPAPARTAVRRLTGPAASTRRGPSPSTRPAKKAAPAPRPKQTADGRAASVPKGPAAFKWQKGYERIVSEFVAPGQKWVVITPGCKSGVERVGSLEGVPFPASDGAAPAADSLSSIAILDAARAAGFERLVLPEGARAWYREHPELRDHVARNHAALVDRGSAGAVFDLTAAAPITRRGLLAEVRDLAASRAAKPAVLDWTDLGVAAELPGITTFAPPATDVLPYFDDSVEIVVVTEDRDLDDAVRVAELAVIVVAPSNGHVRVDDVRVIGADTDAPTIAVRAPHGGALVDAVVSARVSESGATSVAVDEPWPPADADVAIELEPGVVPLPGAISAAAMAVAAAPEQIVVAKVIDSSGRIESAGGTVFRDGTGAGIAAGTLEVRAPWHEFARPACWGAGMIAARGSVWRELGEFRADAPARWCGAAWASGAVVTYQPRAAVVRVEGRGPADADAGSDWSSVLDRRPDRPASLGDGVWRFLLANDDPVASAPGAAT